MLQRDRIVAWLGENPPAAVVELGGAGLDPVPPWGAGRRR